MSDEHNVSHDERGSIEFPLDLGPDPFDEIPKKEPDDTILLVNYMEGNRIIPIAVHCELKDLVNVWERSGNDVNAIIGLKILKEKDIIAPHYIGHIR